MSGREAAAHALQHTPQLRLEQDQKRYQAQLDRPLQERIDHRELEDIRQPQRDEYQDQTLGQIVRIRAPDEPYRFIYQERDYQDIDRVRDADRRQIVSCT